MSRVLFHLTAVMTMAFVITILAMIAMMFGDPAAPVNLWFDRHGATLMLVEVIGIVVFGFAAMTADRHETLQKQNGQKSPDASR